MQRFLRFQRVGIPRPEWGRRDADGVEVLNRAPWLPGVRRTGKRIEPTEVPGLLLLPPAEPAKILALAYNYRDLFLDPEARASGAGPAFDAPGFEPLTFLKGPNCLLGPGRPLALPRDAKEAWVEVELAAVLGRRARNLASREEARAAVFGVTIGNDVTALNVFDRDWHLARSKSRDGFCPLGPELVQMVDDSPLEVGTWINGRRTQHSSTGNRVLDTLDCVIFASRQMTLEPGDVLLTGTPAGPRKSLIASGDEVTLEIERLGRLTTPVVAEL